MDRRDFLRGSAAATMAGTLHAQVADTLSRRTNEDVVTSVDHASQAQPVSDGKHPLLNFVNPIQGTNSTVAFSRGGTLPIVARPFGMAHWALQTSSDNPWFFNQHERRTEGIRCTHQLSPWLSDYGHATFLPFIGKPHSFDPGARGSSYRPQDLQLSPHAVRLQLLRYGATLELTPTERCALLRVTFDEAGDAGLVVDLNSKDAEITTSSASGNTLNCLTRANHGGVPAGFAAFFYVKSDDVPFTVDKVETKDRRLAVLRFTVTAGQTVTFRIATSFIDAAQAAHNAEVELGKRTFDTVRAESAGIWESALGRVRITGATVEQNRTFYSCLYRTLLFPRIWHEPAPSGGMHHRSPYTGAVVAGVMYADHGYWDDYHAWYPMMTLLYPERLGEILQAWVNAYREGGWFPQFPCPGYRAAMTGSLIDSVFGDAVAKGITGFDVKEAYAGLKKHATEIGNPSKGYGRSGLAQYLKLGYVPCDAIGDGAVETLDSAYGDFCIARVATAAGEPADAAHFDQRSLNWRKLFDPQTKFLRGKLTDGSWVEPFDPIRWGDPYVEGAAWQYRFAAPHDVAHLIELHGGAQPFVAALEDMLAPPPNFHVGAYGQEIHEMSEMAVANFGQYAHSNQPVHKVLYLFSIAGRRDRTQYWVHRVLRELYTSEDFPGDEDTGSMSAWYILGCLGLFSHCPGKSEWTLGAPLFPLAVIQTANNGEIRIEAKHTGADGFLAHVSLNGKPLSGFAVPHTELRGKVHLVFSA